MSEQVEKLVRDGMSNAVDTPQQIRVGRSKAELIAKADAIENSITGMKTEMRARVAQLEHELESVRKELGL